MKEEQLNERIWDTIVAMVVGAGGFDGREEEVQCILADMSLEDICEMSWQSVVDEVEEKLG